MSKGAKKARPTDEMRVLCHKRGVVGLHVPRCKQICEATVRGKLQARCKGVLLKHNFMQTSQTFGINVVEIKWESGGRLPQEFFFKLGTLRSLLRPCFGQTATRISPPIVSLAREVIEPSCQE